MSLLPKGWVRATLADVANPRRDRLPPAQAKSLPYLGLDGIKPHSGRIAAYTSSLTVRSPSGHARRGDVAYSKLRPYLNKVAVIDREAAVSAEFLLFPPASGIASPFLFHWLSRPRFVATANAFNTGIGRPRVSWAQLAGIEMALPPLAEQWRIVSAIEEQFSRLDVANVSLTSALCRVVALEASSLHALFEQGRGSMASISSLAQFVTDGDHNPPKRFAHGIPHLTAKNVKNGRLMVDGATFVSAAGFEQTRRRYDPREGDVIVTCVGTIGQTAVVPAGLAFSADRNLAAIRPLEHVDPTYLRSALAAPQGQRAMARASGSTAQPHLYLRDLRALKVPTLPLPEQRDVVKLLEERRSAIDALTVAIERAQRRSTSLRSAILERAFQGQLTPQDASEEPASALLERSRAQRKVTPPRSQRRRVGP